MNFSKTQSIALTGMFGAIIFLLTFTPLGFPQIPLIGSATIIHIPVIIGALLMGPKYGAVLGFMFGLASMIFASTQSLALNAFAYTPLRPVPGTDSGSLWSLLIAFVPRILVGVVTPYVFYALVRFLPKVPMTVKLGTAAVAGAMTNTLLVVHLLYFIFREPWGYARAGAANVHRATQAVYDQNAALAWQRVLDYAHYADMEALMEYARIAVSYETAAAAAAGRIVVDPMITYGFIAGIITGFGIAEALAAAFIAPAVCMALMAVSRRIVPA